MAKVILVTGAARSGKSEWAEHLAVTSEKTVVYIATAMMNPQDAEWQERIRLHQQRRPDTWQVIAEAENIAKAIASCNHKQCLLIDSLGSWVANLLALDKDTWNARKEDLLKCVTRVESELIFVGEETGWGVVPAYASGRLFRDRLGNLIRSLGEIADNSYLVTGGYAVDLKVLGTSLKNIKQL